MGRFSLGLYGQGCIKSGARVALPLTANICLYVPRHVSADPLSLAVSAVGCCCCCGEVGARKALCEIHEELKYRKASEVSLKGGIDCN